MKFIGIVPRAGALVLISLLSANASVENRVPDIPAHGRAIVLFDGTSLNHFDTFLKSKGLNQDPEHVFRVEDGAIHISGTEMGYLITRDSYHDFYLRAEFKWGEGTYGVREGKARDSGILYNVQGENKV